MERLTIYEIEKDINVIQNVALVLHDMKTVYRLCTNQYYKHPKGCPNFNSKEGCPPNVLHISQQYEIDSIKLLYARFAFSEYISNKQILHPDWGLRQLSNQRHWQGHVRSYLDEYWERVKEDYPGYEKIKNPEGQGVNVEETLKNSEIHLDWCKKDENEEIIEVPEYMYHVYLLGKELDE